ncbi:hypothetical protein [Sphingomonas soli]|uniref:hypothetical protein n=1 Tax=Sphingomonas soli TaxID=266127 RepID=UPI000835114B|nr:hypothetical protein [Sphingomonas soli]
MIRRTGLVAGMLALSACSGVIHKQSRLQGNDPVAITVDARQRVILSQWDPSETSAAPGTAKPAFRRYCAEPSPDAFTVLGVAASGSGTLGLDSDAKTLNAALQAAFSSNESGSTISRTQTINMLREMMFRTCERYLSGAISKAQFQTIAARDQRVMVSILAIEQLTGSIAPPPVIINSSGNANTGFDPSEISETLTGLHTKTVEAAKKVTDKKTAYDTVNTSANLCAAATALTDEAIDAIADANDKKAKKDKKAACIKASDELDLAKEEAKAADAIYKGGLISAGRGQGVSAAGTTAGYHVGEAIARKEEVTQVAEKVKDIVALTFAQDETLLFCLQALDASNTGANFEQVRPMCVEYLKAKVKSDAEKLGADFKVGRALLNRRNSVAPRLAQCLANNDATLAGKVKTALAGTSIKATADAFITAAKASANAAATALDDLGSDAETEVIGALNVPCGLGA